LLSSLGEKKGETLFYLSSQGKGDSQGISHHELVRSRERWNGSRSFSVEGKRKKREGDIGDLFDRFVEKGVT